VRWHVTICSSIALLSAAQAQNQEGKLVDRLLRPDTTLQNSAQNKKVGATAAAVDTRGTIGTFYLQPKLREKNFAGTREFPTRVVTCGSFNGRDRTNVSSPSHIVNSQAIYPTLSGPQLPPAHDSEKSIAARSFANQRTFLDQGKSQKALNRQNPPLTIEQVRELLNKNK
jgi:hypothetical protein